VIKKSIFFSGLLLAATVAAHPQEIFDAVKANDAAKVNASVEANPQWLQAKDASGRTPLHWACLGVHYDVLKMLVEKRGGYQCQDNDGIAPLHSLASKAHAEGAALLIAHNADVNVKNSGGDTPLHNAAQSGCFAIVQQLIDHGAAPSQNHFGYTPLLRAILANSLEIAELLMAKGEDVNLVFREDYYGDTPLSFAVKSSHLELVKSLHRNGANIQYRTKARSQPPAFCRRGQQSRNRRVPDRLRHRRQFRPKRRPCPSAYGRYHGVLGCGQTPRQEGGQTLI